jgi:hypothetical protein
VAAYHSVAIDCPGGNAVTVVDLLEPDAAVSERPLDGLSVCDRVVGIGVDNKPASIPIPCATSCSHLHVIIGLHERDT